jgi:hypothetical protein
MISMVSKLDYLIRMDYHRQPPFLYYDSAQKSRDIFIGAVVGESPHRPAGSYILYTNP